MFKIVLMLLCSDLVLSTVSNDPLEQFKREIKPRLAKFEKKNKKWQNDIKRAVTKFDRDHENELKRINMEIDNLKVSKAKCVDKHNDKIENLTKISNSYSSCSKEIFPSTEKNMEELRNKVGLIKTKSQTYEDNIKSCSNTDECVKKLYIEIQENGKNLTSQVNNYIKEAKTLRNNKFEELKKCSILTQMTSEGDEIINKIKSCNL